MKAQIWREKSESEREKAILELYDKTYKLRFDIVTRETKNHSEYRKLKKDIARLLTLKKEDEMHIPLTEEIR